MRLATGGDNGRVRICDTGTGRTLRQFTSHTGRPVWSVGFDPTGKQLVTGGGDGTVRIWDTETGKALYRLAGHNGTVRSVGFDPTGKRLATGENFGAHLNALADVALQISDSIWSREWS